MAVQTSIIANELDVKTHQVDATIRLLDEGNTIPFVARYRKEVTGNLDEVQIRAIAERAEKLRALDDRRATILASIEEQGKLTSELRAAIEAADSLTLLEDLYQPYKPKRKTRASVARERGLQGLADIILSQKPLRQPIEELAREYLNDEVTTVEDAIQGARDIVAETISDHAAVRGEIRDKALRFGGMSSQVVNQEEDTRGTYQVYYDFEYRVDRIKPHQVLAINRGEKEKVLRVKVNVEERDWYNAIEKNFRPDYRSPLAGEIETAAHDSAQRLLLPAIERDIRRTLTEIAEDHAIKVFADNLRGLLTQSPLGAKVIMGLDPGFRTGTKVAVIDETGKVVATATIYPHEPQRQWDAAKQTLERLINEHGVEIISIGNGTASRETERLVAELTRNLPDVHYLIVNEAGASVYSASELARDELPGLDVTLRGAVSIARRVQDPLAELVKIDPKSIGVGLYQHDVNQKALERTLDGVVESVVNQVGVEVNTASPPLLARVAGIGPKLAERIVEHRNKHGAFRNRYDLKQVKGLGDKSFEQSAGFLRVRDGDNPLDASAIHPESYNVARNLLAMANLSLDSTPAQREPVLKRLREQHGIAELAEQLGTGVPTLSDIFEQLVKPGRDPREDVPPPLLRSDVLAMEDLQTGMRLSGTVRNVVDFGAFVDIGVKQDGLLHISKIPRGESVSVGQVIEVEILNIDLERGRISLGWVD